MFGKIEKGNFSKKKKLEFLLSKSDVGFMSKVHGRLNIIRPPTFRFKSLRANVISGRLGTT